MSTVPGVEKSSFYLYWYRSLQVVIFMCPFSIPEGMYFFTEVYTLNPDRPLSRTMFVTPNLGDFSVTVSGPKQVLTHEGPYPAPYTSQHVKIRITHISTRLSW